MRVVACVLTFAVAAACSQQRDAAAPMTDRGCARTGTAEIEELTARVGGRSRVYLVYAPRSPRAGTRAPLLVSHHGRGDNPRNHAEATGWTSFADEHLFVVAFPDGDYEWSLRHDSDDVAFARAVVRDVRAKYCVDADRVFATGHSMGGFFAQRLACDAPDAFAAVTSYAGGPPDVDDPCEPKRPIPVGLFHGDADAVIPLSAGESSRRRWVDRFSCTGEPTESPTEDGTSLRSTRCRGGGEVLWHVYAKQGHWWPTEERRSHMLSTMWRFLTERRS